MPQKHVTFQFFVRGKVVLFSPPYITLLLLFKQVFAYFGGFRDLDF